MPATPFNQFGHARRARRARTTRSCRSTTTRCTRSRRSTSSVGPVALRRARHRRAATTCCSSSTRGPNNFAYVGHRATGTAAGDFLLVPPGWDGAAPDGATVDPRSRRAVGTIVGRWACRRRRTTCRPSHALQDAMTLEPLDARRRRRRPSRARPARGRGPRVLREAARLVAGVPAGAARRRATRQRFAPLGVAPTGVAVRRRRRGPRAALRDGLAAGRAAPGERILTSVVAARRSNGWKLTLHVFDYNLDYFEVGALDDDRVEDRRPEAAHRRARGRGHAAGCGATTPTRRPTS